MSASPTTLILAPPLELQRRHDGRLWACLGDEATAVKPTRCFPWSEPDRYISLRDADDKEVAFVADPAELDDGSRAALDETLAEVGFLFEITAILTVKEEVEIRTWTVQTRQGTRTFQTARDAWPRELPSGAFLVRDVAGDLYRISAPDTLDRVSCEHLWAFVQ